MAFRNREKGEASARNILDGVLPQYQRLSEAPSSVMALDAYRRAATPEERERIASGFMERERGKLYKSLDRFGNVVLVVNPICWPARFDSLGIATVVKPQPRIVIKREDLARKKKERTSEEIDF